MANLGLKTATTVYNIEAQPGSMVEQNGQFHLNLTNRLGANGLLGAIPTSLSGERWVLTVLIGANDLDIYGTPALWYAALLAVTNPIRAKGVKIGLCTVLNKASPWVNFAAFNALAATANTLIRGSVAANEADFVIDLAAVSGLTYVDGLHPDAAGHLALEPTYRTAILSQLL